MLVEQHLVPQLGAVQLQNLNAAQINAHYARLLKEGRVHGSGGLSPNTVHHVHAVLHRALRDAVKWGYLQTNVAACADPPRASAQHRELAVWSEEQLHAFLDSVAKHRLYPLWRFLAMTGCPTKARLSRAARAARPKPGPRRRGGPRDDRQRPGHRPHP